MANANLFASLLRPVKSVQEYDDERDERAARKTANAIQSLALQQQTEQAGAAAKKRNALEQVMASMKPNATDDERANAFAANPYTMDVADQLRKSSLERREKESKITGQDATNAKTGFETQEAKRKAAVQQIASLNSPEEAVGLLNQQVAAGAISMQAAQALERMVKTDPKWQLRLIVGISDPKEMMAALQPHMQNAGGALVNTNPLAGPTGQGAPNAIPITESANEQLQARTSRANNAATVAATIAGQDKTDARARDFNDISRQIKATPKPMPGTAVKLQNEDLEAIGTFSGLDSDLAAIEGQLSSGKLKLGLLTNAAGSALNAVGMSTDNSRNLASFKAKLENMRNESLRLNKGVQTEGDSVRAWNEAIANINDPGIVAQRLAEIRALNKRAVALRKNNVDLLRSNYGAEALDYSKYDPQPAALDLPKPGAPAKTKSGATASNW
jgi:hypothetical protein